MDVIDARTETPYHGRCPTMRELVMTPKTSELIGDDIDRDNLPNTAGESSDVSSCVLKES